MRSMKFQHKTNVWAFDGKEAPNNLMTFTVFTA